MELHPHLDEVQRSPIDQFDNRKPSASWYYKEAFESLFPGEQVPEEVGAPCCAEFAVTDRVIRERPRSDYERYRRWLIETDSSDYVSGRTLESSWHSKSSQASHSPLQGVLTNAAMWQSFLAKKPSLVPTHRRAIASYTGFAT